MKHLWEFKKNRIEGDLFTSDTCLILSALLYNHDYVFKTLIFWPCRCFTCSKKCKSWILQHMSMQASSQQHQDMQKSAKMPWMIWATASSDKCAELFVRNVLSVVKKLIHEVGLSPRQVFPPAVCSNVGTSILTILRRYGWRFGWSRRRRQCEAALYVYPCGLIYPCRPI